MAPDPAPFPLARFASLAGLDPAPWEADPRDRQTQAAALLDHARRVAAPRWLDLCPETAGVARALRLGLPIGSVADLRRSLAPSADPLVADAAYLDLRASGLVALLSACWGWADRAERRRFHPQVFALVVAAATLARCRGVDTAAVAAEARGDLPLLLAYGPGGKPAASSGPLAGG